MDSFKFITVRLGKDSISDINQISSSKVGVLDNPFVIKVKCTQIPENYKSGDYAFIWLGSDNNKGAQTKWKMGFKAVGKVIEIKRGTSFNDTSETTLVIRYIFKEAVNKMDVLRCAPYAYYWFSSFPVIGPDDHANQTIRLMSGEEFSDIRAFFKALEETTDNFKEDIIRVEPAFAPYFDLKVPSPKYYPSAKTLSEVENNLSLEKNKIDQESRQQIFFGAPGTGKSDTIDRIVQDVAHTRTTFHPDSDYASFVGAYKPRMSSSSSIQRLNLSVEDLAQKLGTYYNDSQLGKVGGIQKFCLEFYPYIDGEYMSVNVTKLLELAGVSDNYGVEINKYLKFCRMLPKREDNKIVYSFTPQAFLKAYCAAWKQMPEPYFLVIEEINRGNCAQIFGDLFQLLDRNEKGYSKYEIAPDDDIRKFLSSDKKEGFGALTEEQKANFPKDSVWKGEELILPPNLYIWATMNTSDQSLFPIDSAFKRRWEWKYIKITNGYKKNENGEYETDAEGKKIPLNWKIETNGQDWYGFIQQINKIISNMTSSADKQLGYFFCQANEEKKITTETFVSKVLFYLWNDVFKDYGFDDANLFKYKKEDGKEEDLTFPEFYDEDGNVVDDVVKQFIEHVMAWKGDDKKESN